jgi:transcription initiation factor IIF auxiliary subunit
MEGFPMRSWSVEIWMLDDAGNLIPASVFEKVTYELHPTFPKPKQVFKKPPFKIDERGWGEFDMILRCTTVGRGSAQERDHPISHDLNFQHERYEATHTLVRSFTYPPLLALGG